MANSVVCTSCFAALYGFSQSTLKRAKRSLSGGHVNTGPAVVGRLNSNTPQLDKVMAWLRCHGELHGDFMPHEMVVEFPEYTVRELYSSYLTSMLPSGETTASISTLHKAMKLQDCGMRLRTRKTFKTCTTCDTLSHSIKTTCDPVLRGRYVEEKVAHLEFQSQERRAYAATKTRATQFPEQVLSIVMDDMDQAKTCLPQTDRPTTEKQECPKLRVHITGIRVHGSPHYTKVFTWYDHFPADANVPIEVLLRTLAEIKAHRGVLPPSLFIQFDNCRVNKNRWVIALLAALVAADVFDSIQMNFLLVGHTHCDIDQVFSVIARALRQSSSVSTLPELHGVITGCMQGTKALHVEHLEDICDWKPWLNSIMRKISKHSVPRSFLFRKVDGEARMWVAGNMQDANDKYEPEGGLLVIRSQEKSSDILPPSALRLVPRRALSVATFEQGI